MAKFRKRPTIIEAVQFTGEFPYPSGVCDCGYLIAGVKGGCQPHIHTLEGRMDITEGDWIITGIKGELYPCKSEIFAASYEAVSDS